MTRLAGAGIRYDVLITPACEEAGYSTIDPRIVALM